MGNEKSNISAILKTTGLSASTVSRALNDDTAHMVNAKTREMIFQAASRFNYIPDRMARSLRKRKADTFGFLMNFDTDTISGYIHEVMNGILEGLRATQFDLKIVSSARQTSLDAIIRTHGLDGLILPYGYAYAFPNFAEESARYRSGLWPVVVINDYNPRYHISQLYSDNVLASQQLTSYLIDKGYKRFYLIGCGDDSPDATARKNAFIGTLKKHGIRFDEGRDSANGHFEEMGGYRAALELLDKRPSFRGAIFCINDAMALGAIRAVGEAKLRCPQDIAVAGFDGLIAGEFSNPPLTTIKFELSEMGKTAVDILKDIVSGKQKKLIRKKFPFKLVERQSC